MPIMTRLKITHEAIGISDHSRSAKDGRINRRRLLSVGAGLAAAMLAFAAPAHAEQKNVKIALDWIVQATHAPFFIAQQKGYFKDAGVTVDAIDPGKGATQCRHQRRQRRLRFRLGRHAVDDQLQCEKIQPIS